MTRKNGTALPQIKQHRWEHDEQATVWARIPSIRSVDCMSMSWTSCVFCPQGPWIVRLKSLNMVCFASSPHYFLPLVQRNPSQSPLPRLARCRCFKDFCREKPGAPRPMAPTGDPGDPSPLTRAELQEASKVGVPSLQIIQNHTKPYKT